MYCIFSILCQKSVPETELLLIMVLMHLLKKACCNQCIVLNLEQGNEAESCLKCVHEFPQRNIKHRNTPEPVELERSRTIPHVLSSIVYCRT